MIFGTEYKKLIQSEIKNGHIYETYIIYNSGEHIVVEYVDGELMYIYTTWR